MPGLVRVAASAWQERRAEIESSLRQRRSWLDRVTTPMNGSDQLARVQSPRTDHPAALDPDGSRQAV